MRHTATQLTRFALAAAVAPALALATGAAPAQAGVNFWTPLGPDGGSIVALATSPAQPSLVFAAAFGSGVFRSQDGGGTWVRASRGLDPSVESIAVDPQTPATVYAGSVSGIAKSVDGGASWGPAAGPSFAVSLAVDPRSPSTLYAATFRQLAKSSDGGVSWVTLSAGSGEFSALAIDPARPATIYAVRFFGSLSLLRSDDSGATWAERDAGLPLASANVGVPVQLGVDPTTVPSTLYAAFEIGNTPATFRSTDSGDSWHPAGPGGYPLAAGQGVVYAGASKSTDGGATWVPAAAAPGQANVLAAVPGSATAVYAGTALQGVWKSSDAAASWQAASAGLTATRPVALAIDPVHPRILYAGALYGFEGSGLFKSGSAGRAWHLIGPPWLVDYLGKLVIDPVTPSTLYAASGRGLAKSTDAGATWEVVQSAGGDGCSSFRDLAIDPSHPETLYAAAFPGVACSPFICPALKSSDGGHSWSCLGLALDDVSRIFVAPSAPATLYAFGQVKVQRHVVVGVWKSTDGGATWHESDRGLHQGGGGFLALAIDPTNANRVFASGTNGVFLTTDGGRTWSERDHKLPIEPFSNTSAQALAIDPRTPATVYAGGGFGVYRSTNGGLAWYPVNGGLPDFYNGLLVLDPQQAGKLYAGTFASGFYTYTVQ